MRFSKLHGAGNDYVVVDARNSDMDWPMVARAVCHRHFGVGSDGLILVLPSQRAEVRMRIFNPDGSEAEMCGNGIRCLAKFVLERGIVPSAQKALRVETLAGVRTVEPFWHNGKVVRARVSMGAPILAAEAVPVDPSQRLVPVGQRAATLYGSTPRGTGYSSPPPDMAFDWPLVLEGRAFTFTAVSMGNPHAITFLDEPVETFPLHRYGPLAEHHPLFPRRVNWEVVNVRDRKRLQVRVWERGAGETLACGTGACAVAVAARLHGYVDDTVDINLPGGVLTVHWDGAGEVILEGPVEEVFEGQWLRPWGEG
ncbi:MAG: diaminopimelate epimerase [Dehalococcoidia bacterium]|nr:diaminopimelate epimerase [Dehalococcoidia bacterium]MDW8119265.1 diaminopimelate epimerase [Chloroflexota bacterium]